MKIQLLYIFLTAVIVPSIQFRVIRLNNKTSDDNPAPWHVSLRIHGVHYCSGAIVNEREVVTASQCIFDDTIAIHQRMYNIATIKIGNRNLYNGTRIHEVEKINYPGHPKMIINNTPADGHASIRIKGSFGLGGPDAKPIPPIYYDGGDYSFYGEFNVSSWGYNPYVNAGSSPTLTIKKWRGITHELCERYYGGDIDNTAFCGVSIDDNVENPCAIGDLGDPAIVNGKLVGLKMHKKDCKLFPNFPSLFTTIDS